MRSSRSVRVLALIIALAGSAGCDDDDPRPDSGARDGAAGDAADAAAAAGKGGGSAGSSGTGGAGPAGDLDAGADAGDAGGTKVQLKVAWWGSSDRHMRTQRVIELFEAAHPEIAVSAEHYDNTQGKGIVGTDYWPTLNQHAADGTLPDVMQHDYAYIEEWTKRGLLRPLDDEIADGTLNMSDVLPALIDGGKVGGKVMGITLGINTQSIVVDTNAFADAQIPLPGDDWTWADFEQIALQIKAKLGIFGFGVGLYSYTPGWKAVVLSTGQWVFSDDGMALGYSDDAPWIEHWKMILRLQAAGALPRKAQEPPTANIETVPLALGKAAMEFAHSNQLVALWTAAGTARTLRMLPLPRVVGGKSPVYLKPSQYFSITSTCAHPKEAALLVDFFTNDVDANIILGGERGVPIASKVLAALKPKLSKMAVESFNLIERASVYATKLPPNDPPAWTPILTQIFDPKVVDPIMSGAATPEAAVALFRSEASLVLAGNPVPDSGAAGGADAGVDAP
jgi:multiple sugar transport system substrate-binding protein